MPAENRDHDSGTTSAVRVIYAGRVQGVGFRFTVKSLAHEYQIRGWVRNDPDGTVELVAASGEQLEPFLQAIDSRIGSYILTSTRSQASLASSVIEFEIRR